MRRVSLIAKFAVLLLASMVVALPVGMGVVQRSWEDQAAAEMLEKAQILSKELDAFWEFMERNEDRINTDAQGNYEFKGLYCVVAAKSVSSLFTASTDYSIRYTGLEPRKLADSPDEFETSALLSFGDGRSTEEYYDLADYDGRLSFRYVKAIRIEESCLRCHGEPAGELDLFGYEKEGKKIGDLAGAVSIVMPVDNYMEGISENAKRTTALFCALLATCMAAVVAGLVVLVIRPLGKLTKATAKIRERDFDVKVDDIGWRDEMSALAEHVGDMARDLDALTANLEDKVSLRTSQLAEANAELKEKQRQLEEANAKLWEENEFKSDYLATMSHELKTPLTSIIAFTEIWSKEARAGGGEERGAVEEIRVSGQILLGIVNNILEMSRIDAGRATLDLEPVDMVDLVGFVEGVMAPLAQKKQIKLRSCVEADVPMVFADWEKMRRIVENLISNAVKYTHEGGEVDVRVKLSDDRQGAVITVADNGIGIKPEDQETIFSRYDQGEGARKHYDGTGIGLAVVRELTALHGGSVSLTSEYGKGSEFAVTIPLGAEKWKGLE